MTFYVILAAILNFVRHSNLFDESIARNEFLDF